MFAERISIRRSLQYENIYLAYFISVEKEKSEGKRERERENQPVGRFHPEHSTEMNHKSTRATGDRFINAKRREIIRNRAEMNYTLRK